MVYPSEADGHPIPITQADLDDLSEGSELSDVLVDVCLRQFQEKMNAPERCVVLNALWLWAAKVDVSALARASAHLLDVDFIYVPMCSRGHWAGAVVCRGPGRSYRILVLDSLRRGQSPFDPRSPCEVLAEAMKEIWRTHRSGACPRVDWVVVTGVPVQPNLVDCALYMVLLFIRHNASLPPLHLQVNPRWEGGAFQPSLTRTMRDELRHAVLACKR